jgi:hypothetical protein
MAITDIHDVLGQETAISILANQAITANMLVTEQSELPHE